MVLLTVICLPIHAHAGLFRNAADLAESSIFGAQSQFDSVGLFTGQFGEFDVVTGSGVLIDPHWVLTSGHQLQAEPGVLFESLQYRIGTDLFAEQRVIEADFFTTFPGYLSSSPPGTGNDIGLVRLSEPVFDIDPAVLFTGADDLFGIEFTAAGFGNPGIGPFPGEFDGIRRAGRNLADNSIFFAEEQYISADFDLGLFSNIGLPLE